jgi:hypothetical protein
MRTLQQPSLSICNAKYKLKYHHVLRTASVRWKI